MRMNRSKVFIFTNPKKKHEEEIVKQMEKICRTAAQMANQQVSIEVATEVGRFERLSMDVTKTPILIINNVVEFSGRTPPVDLVRQCFMRNQPRQQM